MLDAWRKVPPPASAKSRRGPRRSVLWAVGTEKSWPPGGKCQEINTRLTRRVQGVTIAALRAWVGFRLNPDGKYRLIVHIDETRLSGYAMVTTTPAIPKPFLRWAGSKRKQIPRLREFWSADYDRYVEPFAGSACFFFSLCPEKALLADKNADLIEAFELVRDNPNRVYDRVVAIPRTKERYYLERARNPAKLTRLQRAVRFIYLNRNCFNGIYRTNQSGQFNVPFATSRAGAFVTRDEFIEASRSLQRATLRSWDFGTTLRYVRDGDFVYLDPPYAVESRRVFREYGERPFCSDDLFRLSEHLTKIHNRNAAFLVSYADCREARALAEDWFSYRMRVRRHIAGFAGARKAAYELLITNIELSK